MYIRVGLLAVAIMCLGACDDGPDDSTSDDGTTEATTAGETGDDTTTTGNNSSTTGETMCQDNSDCGSGQICQEGTCVTDPGSFWVVGGMGEIINVSPTDAEHHPSPEQRDLAAITCYGNKRAWYVGAGGAGGYTEDGGQTWWRLELPSVDLRAVASTDPLRVAVVGAGGTMLESTNGIEFEPVSGAQGVLTGVDLTPSATVAVGSDGRVWVHEFASEGAVKVHDAGVELHDLDFGDHTPIGAAVGAGGALLWSIDGGYTWQPRESHTSQDLFAVQVSSTGDQAIAVGANGVVVTIAGHSVEATQVDTADLNAIHLDAWGRGAAVGAQGHVLHTSDAGKSFVGHTVSTVELFGVDALGERHW